MHFFQNDSNRAFSIDTVICKISGLCATISSSIHNTDANKHAPSATEGIKTARKLK